jgi:glycosyltransferase involved in cell wall biosynthesis
VPQTLQATPTISVIVATRNRRESLGQFLDGLRSLPEQPAWELIVVDNGSADGTKSLLSTAAEDLPIVVVNEKLPGKSRALNAALNHAGGEILLFTDDDVVPDPNWLMALHKASVEHPSANVFGGRILLNYERIPKWILKSYNLKTILTSEQDLGGEIRWFAKDQYPMGPNLAVRRRVIDQGPFCWPVNLGPGTKIPVGDERAFLLQVSSPEARDRLYVPDCVVQHNICGRQLSIIDALLRCFLGGYAAGLVGRISVHSNMNINNERSFRVAWQRFRGASGTRELICMVARAVGVMVGTSIPCARVIYG